MNAFISGRNPYIVRIRHTQYYVFACSYRLDRPNGSVARGPELQSSRHWNKSVLLHGRRNRESKGRQGLRSSATRSLSILIATRMMQCSRMPFTPQHCVWSGN